MKIKFRKFFLLILFFYFSSAIVHSDEIEEKNFSKIYKNIRCLICQGQSIDESDTDFARNLKILIKDKIISGSSENEVYDFLKNKYGDWIILKPAFNLKNLFLWSFPYLIFVFGGFYLFFIIKKSKLH